jgi:hypothetical protein
MASRIQLRRGTGAQWTSSNPVLSLGEPGAETDTGRLKIGDGVTAWVNLPYAGITAVTIDMLPSGSTLTVIKSGSTWPQRPTTRTDIVVAWKGADPSPAVVNSGTAGMLNNVDYRIVV